MPTDRECVDYAHECMRLAGLTNEPEIRDQLLHWLASGWPLDVLIFPSIRRA
jgi:hypothetical protein